MEVIAGFHHVGRIIIALYFLLNAYNHLLKANSLVGYAQFKGVKSAKKMVIFSGILLLLGGLSFLFMFYMKVGAVLLLLFMIPVTFKMHAFWKETDPQAKMMEKVQFMKNVAIIGILLMIL